MIRRKANNTDFLDIFGLSGPSKKVLMDIFENGDSSVAMIAARLNSPKSTVYDAVAPLVDKSLVNEYSGEHGKVYGISDADQLTRAHEAHIEQLQAAQSSLLQMIMSKPKKSGFTKPKIKFYSGTLGIKQAFRDIMWSKDYKETYLLWSTKDMMAVDEDFFRWHGTQRFKYDITMYSIESYIDRPLEKVDKYQWLKGDPVKNKTHLRFLPKGVTWNMSFWMYGDKCLFSSSGEERIAFTVHSKEFCDTVKIMWQSLWDQAKL